MFPTAQSIEECGALRAAASAPSIEQEIQAKGLTAPRVTPARINQVIANEYYFTAGDGIEHALRDVPTSMVTYPVALSLLTICVLELANGYTVLGKSACASPENFDAELGKRIAREDAVKQIWPLEGYLLRQQLHEDALLEAEKPVVISPAEQLSRDLTEQARSEALGG
jgi:hypothetical protein